MFVSLRTLLLALVLGLVVFRLLSMLATVVAMLMLTKEEEEDGVFRLLD